MTLMQDAASSSSALATPSGVSVAAKCASQEQTDEPAVGRFSFGTIIDKAPCHDLYSTGHSNEASKLDPEVLEAVFLSNGAMLGKFFCLYLDGVRNSKKEEVEVNLVERLHEPMVLKLLPHESEKIDMILAKVPFTRILLLMHFQESQHGPESELLLQCLA